MRSIAVPRSRTLVAVVMFFVASAAYGSVAIESFVDLGSFSGSQSDQTLGWRFHLNSPVWLTSLGVYDYLGNGFVEPHEVGLWTSTGTLLADGFLPAGTSGTLLNGFRYVDAPNVPLPVGNYVIGAHFIGTFVDPFSDGNVSVSTHPFVEYGGRNGNGPGFQFPSTFMDSNSLNFITSNFQFSLVPEPGALLLGMVAGVACLLPRGRRA